jgi:amino acid adenylation domain-containing protein
MVPASAGKSVEIASPFMTTTLDEINRLSPEKKRALLEQLLRERAGQPAPAPLSSGQERLWFLDRLQPNSPLYNIPTALRLKGELNEAALRKALNEIVRRHESLRTTFAENDGAPAQKINPPAEVPFHVIDLTHAVNGSQEIEARRRIREAANQPFDLSRDLMIRATLLRLAPSEHILLLVVHHIAGDEWSLRILFKELSLLYEAHVTGREMNLPELPAQYSDYARWQRELIDSPAFAEHLDYWRKQLDGCTPNLEMPSDAPRSAGGDHHGSFIQHIVSAETLDAVKALSRRENATLFMTLLATFNVLLHRYTRQDDILVGSPIAGRTRAEMEELIGFFVNTLVLRAQLRDDMSFTDLLKQVRETTVAAYAHQDLPFEKLVETLHPERIASGSPLVQVMFAFESGYVDEQLLPGLQVEMLETETGTAKFDLTVVAMEEHGALKLFAEYDSDLFSGAMIARLLGHFENLLKAIVAQPEAHVLRHDFLGAAEKKRLLIEWNDTRREYPRNASVSRLVEHWAATRAASPAVTYGKTTLSYAELNARANQLAQRLQKLGLKPGEVVGVMMERSNEMAVAMLGILKAGGGYLPLDPSYPQERLAFMINDSGARFLIAQPETAAVVTKHSAETIVLDGTFTAIARESKENLAHTPDALDLANLIYTSGSTGTPKGVKIPHRGIVRLVRDTDYMEIAPTDVVTQTSSISFDAATWEIWTALVNGAHLVGISKDELINPAAFREKIKEKKVTIVFVTTALFNQLASEAAGVFEGLKYVFFGGEASDPKAVASVLNNRPPRRLMHAYGPTETTVYATVHRVKDVPPGATTIPIGRPIANSTAYVVDHAGNLAPIGIPGELWLGGDGMALGYLNRPELTSERFVSDKFGPDAAAKLYRSGDLARFREDGAIEFLGRVDTQVKIRGFRIELGEIEATLLKHPNVRKAAVLAREDVPGEKRLVGYIECSKKTGASDLKNLLKQTLPEFMVPAAFVGLDQMPLLPNGKVNRNALPAPEWKSTDRVFEAPANPLEQQIAKIWERVLGVQPIGATDNFFDLGGHSLLAVKLFAQFEKVFERKLPLATLFKAPTIRQLADYIRGEAKPQTWSTIVDIQPKGTKRPIFWIHSLGGDGGGGFFYYRRLATLLGQDQPSFGIRSPQEPFDKIESMAAYYIRALKEMQPQGPYQLGGFCFGGVVAYEMARQLENAGDKVSLLAILESSPPNLDRLRDHLPRSARFRIENVYENLRDFVSHPTSEQLAMVKRKARKVRDKFSRRNGDAISQPPPALQDLIDMSKYPKDYVKYAETHWKALESYVPGSYDGTIHLFRARKQPLRITDPSLGWNVVAPGRVRISVIPGTHESMVTDPNVQILADKIQETIRASST